VAAIEQANVLREAGKLGGARGTRRAG
jgi:hypothetical protein